MEAASLPADTPLWRRHLHPDGYGYGWLLALIVVSLSFQLGAPDTGWARLVTIILQSATVIGALSISHAHRWLLRAAAVAVTIAILSSGGILIGSGELSTDSSRVVGFLLVLCTPAAIVAGLVRQTRAAGAITIPTMFGVLCIYLLIGMAFAFAFGLIEAFGDVPFFQGGIDGTQPDFLYFSFVTLTTTGYGDLIAATDLGRSFAITEALTGQIYLVTVVALIVSNLGRRRRPQPR